MRQVTVVSPLNCVFDCIMSLHEMNYHGKAVLKCQTAKVSFTTSVAFGLIKVCKILQLSHPTYILTPCALISLLRNSVIFPGHRSLIVTEADYIGGWQYCDSWILNRN